MPSKPWLVRLTRGRGKPEAFHTLGRALEAAHQLANSSGAEARVYQRRRSPAGGAKLVRRFIVPSDPEPSR